MEQPTIGELALMIGNIATDITEIRVQTTKTNGRVGKLEAFRNMLMGGLLITNIILVPVSVAIAISVVTSRL